ncbi:hypothetical protein CAMGR0001_0149 [Campylobacter gracilis RM3268]|uniref:Uncharacterized protein n=1 Tax=Campylobacter gracilis RM3268 TaxID=553220 RepID=C8PKD3_9BACT|nr:hypothetical protein CAMGR0001_0149 [Campylobacter gracilis RM3268]
MFKFINAAYRYRVRLPRRRIKCRDLTARNQSNKTHPPRSKALLASVRLSVARRRVLAAWQNTTRRLRLRPLHPRIFETSNDPHRR